MKHLLCSTALVFVTLMAPAHARVTGDPLKVEGGLVEGTWAQNASVRAYLGVPYAAAPIELLPVLRTPS